MSGQMHLEPIRVGKFLATKLLITECMADQAVGEELQSKLA